MEVTLSGDVVLPDRIVAPGTVVIDHGVIAEVRADARVSPHQRYIVPGFVDVHVHGADGIDVLDGAGAIRALSRRLVRYGVTSFCPTTVACDPSRLRLVLDEVRELRDTPPVGHARVLQAHLESNFLNPRYRGAQPLDHLRLPGADEPPHTSVVGETRRYTGADVLREIDRASDAIAIVTLAPELDGGLELVSRLTALGLRVSLGHSAATFEQARDAIAAGARHATHLFNRMAAFEHRAPGLVGAVLASADVTAELVCDGHHLHSASVRVAVNAKGTSNVVAITDGTAASGLPVGTKARLGGQLIETRDTAAFLPDGTLAGSTATMDRVFRFLVEGVGFSLVDAALMCATTPARSLGRSNGGALVADAAADLVVLDRNLSVEATYVNGELAYTRLDS